MNAFSPQAQALATTALSASHPDAQLLALGAQLLRAEQKQQEAWAIADGERDDNGPRTLAAEAATAAANEIVHQIVELQATTFTGLRVKALGVRCIYQPDPVDVETLFGTSPGEHVTTDHKLICGVLSDLLTAPAELADDADLLAACAAFDDLERQWRAAIQVGSKDNAKVDEAAAQANRIQEQQRPHLDAMLDLPCTTLAGAAAIARSLELWDAELMRGGNGYVNDLLVRKLVESLLAMGGRP